MSVPSVGSGVSKREFGVETHLARPEDALAQRAITSEEDQMATYVVLANFTEQGIRDVKETPKRAEAFKEMAKKHGATIKEMYWTLGRYDIVTIMDVPDEVSATALGLSVGSRGNVRTETLRAFAADEMKTIIGKMS
jgi:uncharacterized protein with GYD domain